MRGLYDLRSGFAMDASFKNEDRCVILEADDWCVYGALDGHGGKAAVLRVVDVLPKVLVECLRLCDEDALLSNPEGFRAEATGHFHKEYARLDAVVQASARDNSGVCVTMLFVCRFAPFALVSHLGDCRVVMVRNGLVSTLTKDHQLTNPDEMRRVLATGHRPTCNGRVAGLEPTRTIGDADVKDFAPGAVSCLPEVLLVPLHVDLVPQAPPAAGKAKRSAKSKAGDDGDGHTLLLVATDGVWCSLADTAAATAASKSLFKAKGTPNAKAAAAAVTTLARNKGSLDDIATVAVCLTHR